MFAGGFQNPGRAVQFNGPAEECQEDGRNGPPYLSGRRQPVRGGVQAADERSGDIIQVEVDIKGAVFGV